MGPQPTSAMATAQLELRTYYGYIVALAEESADENAMLAEQSSLLAFGRLQGDRSLDLDAIRQHLFRGWLTLKAMDALPVDEDPDVATIGNLWAPVQAYYAVHAVGMATMIALGSTPPQSHRASLAAMANNVVPTLLPKPLSIMCSGDATSNNTRNIALANCGVSADDARRASNLANPRFANREALIAKALVTTRKKLLQVQFNRARGRGRSPGRSRRNLPSAERARIVGELAPTSVLDFLYRMRIRSNYDDADMYVYGQQDAATAQSHYHHLVHLTRTVVSLLERIIERRIGRRQVQQLKDDFGNRFR